MHALRFSVVACLLLYSFSNALKPKCDSFSGSDSIVVDFYHDNEITRYKAYYRNNLLYQVQASRKADQILLVKYFSDLVEDSSINYDNDGVLVCKVNCAFSGRRKERLGKYFNTREYIQSQYIGDTTDIARKTMTVYRYGSKYIEAAYRNEEMVKLEMWGYDGYKAFTVKRQMDSVARYYSPVGLDVDLSGRPPSEIMSYIKSYGEIRDFYSKCLSYYKEAKGEVVVQFTIQRDGSVSEALLLKNSLPCKNLAIELMNIFKNMQFPADPRKYGPVTVTYPFTL